jgi:hypothetical protein
MIPESSMYPEHSGGPETQTEDQIQTPTLIPLACKQKRQLLADYVERVQALAVETEMLFQSYDRLAGDLGDRWYRVEQARINCDIARLALGTHTSTHRC